MLKNTFSILFLSVCLLLASCGKKADSEETTQENSTTENVESSPLTEVETTSAETEETAEPKSVSGKSGVLIHVMEGQEPYKFLLALDMAERMAADHDVMVYFDHLAVNAVMKDAKDVQYSPFTPMREQLGKLKKLGVKMRACEPCVAASWRKPEELSPEVTMFKPAELTELGGGNVMTFSY
ncbi:MAG: DsrE family protein [Bacteroidia bacterium]|nr:DsrE family protein [Bacteroidia bacterium]